MADKPVTREEKYLAYLTGDYTGEIPKPITRKEKYLYELCLKGMGGEISPEEIKNAVNEYLEKNPVKPGATAEQAQQIEQNKTDIGSLKTETGSLKGDLYDHVKKSQKAIEDLNDKKITKFYANSLGETTLNDSDKGKIQDMMLYGKSEQKQYSGKNLLKQNLKNYTSNGVTFTNNGNGSYALNGTATNNNALCGGTFTVYNLKAGTYTLSNYDLNGNLSRLPPYITIGLYRENWDESGLSNLTNIDTKTFTISTDEEVLLVYIRVIKGNTVDNLVIRPMLELDSTATDYEPYVGGIPSPNPDYPQEIKSVVNPVVKVCGKNLLNATLQTTTQNGVTCTNNGDGTYTLNGTATALIDIALSTNFHIENGKMYRITGWVKNVPGFIYLINGKDDARDTGDGVTFTYNDVTNDSKVIHIQTPKGAIINNVIIKPMICTDASATYDDFEPYHEQTVTLPYTLNAIPVISGGNITIDGQQYVADYVDVERGKRVIIVDDSKLDPTVSVTDNTDLLLDDPIEVDLTPEEVQAFKDLAAHYPTTNVFVTSDQLDGYTEFNYPLSMENGWNLIKEQLGDTREYIYDMDLQSAEAYVNSEYAVALAELGV